MFKSLQKNSRGFKRVQKGSKASSGFRTAHDIQRLSGGFKRVQQVLEGSKAFRRVQKLSGVFKNGQEGSTGFNWVQKGFRTV